MALVFASLLLPLLSFHGVSAQQQPYSGQPDLTCTSQNSRYAGYFCSDAQPNCSTLAAYYRVRDGQSNLNDIASLLGANVSSIAAASHLSISPQLSAQQPLLVPLDCSCSGSLSQMIVSYIVNPGDTFLTITNTYEGLTTCQAIRNATNPSLAPESLQVGQPVKVPLRCACPSQEQVEKGIKLLLTYLVEEGDNPFTISTAFAVDLSVLLASNNLSSTSQIYPATTLLVPLQVPPQYLPPISGTSPPPPLSSTPPSPPSSSKAGVYVGISVAVIAVVLSVAALGWFVARRRTSRRSPGISTPSASLLWEDAKTTTPSKIFMADMTKFTDIEQKLPVYSVEELKKATQNFSASCLIKGLVYRGVLKDRVVAIKKMERDVSQEVGILRKVHHTNLVALLGVCIGGPDQSFLVYEYAENGSLSDWLHELPRKESQFPSAGSSFLSWTARLRIAADVADALEYMHDHTSPSFVHKDIKSSNILLDSNFRGKVANFGLAKSTENMQHRAALTRHIVGTQGYMSPEYLRDGFVSSKLDVFAFGVVLLEMLSGEEPIIRDEEGGQVMGKEGYLWTSIGHVLDGEKVEEKLAAWMDPVLGDCYPFDCAYSLAQLAKRCVVEDPVLRPSMRDVVIALLQMLEASKRWESSGADKQMEGR